MAYGNQNSPDTRRTANRDFVNTNGVSFRNPKMNKYMNVAYWETCLTMEIGVMPPEAMTDFRAVQPPTVRQVISFSDIANLLGICEDIEESIKKTGQFSPAGVRAGSDANNIIEISNGSNINQADGIYLVIYKNLDQGNRTNDIDFYPFQSRKVIRGYDHLSGAMQEDYSKSREFKDFVLVIREAAKAFTNAQAHAIKKAQKSDTLSHLKLLGAIAGKQGVDPAALGVRIMEANTSGGSENSRPQYGGQRRQYGGNGGGGSWQNRGNSGYGQNRQFGGGQPRFTSGNNNGNGGRSTPFEGGDGVEVNLDANQLSQIPF